MNSYHFLKRRPVTGWFLIIAALSFLINFFSFSFPWFELLSFESDKVMSKIWSIFTYPLAQNEIASLVFSGLWAFTVCSILEEVLSSYSFLILLGISILITPTLFHVINYFYSVSVILAGFWTPLSFLTIYWGAKYPDRVLMFHFLFPIKAVWLAYITIALLFFSFRDPVISSMMLIPCIIFFYAGKFFPFHLSSKKRKDQGFKTYIREVNHRKKEREEKEKLRQLFEKSFKDKRE